MLNKTFVGHLSVVHSILNKFYLTPEKATQTRRLKKQKKRNKRKKTKERKQRERITEQVIEPLQVINSKQTKL